MVSRFNNVQWQEVKDNKIITLIGWLMLAGLTVALIRVAILNIAPYAHLLRMAGAENTQDWVYWIPGVGWLLKQWGNLVNAIGAVLVWAAVQSFQCLWIVIKLDRQAYRGAIAQSKIGRYELRGEDDGRTRKIERSARRIPYAFIRWSALLALAAYTFDLVVGCLLYPPADSFQKFFFALSSGATNLIDTEASISLLLMLFSFEALLVPFVIVAQWQFVRRQS